MARSGRGFWTAPQWSNDSLVSGPGVTSDANGYVLLGLADADEYHDRPVVVQRIIGQYNIITNASTALNALIHSRIFTADTDIAAGTVATPDLFSTLDAEQAFLWHEITFCPPTLGASTWEPMGTGTAARHMHQRAGAFDIRVARKIEEIQSLIWASQIGIAVPAPGDFALQIWCRLYMREVD